VGELTLAPKQSGLKALSWHRTDGPFEGSGGPIKEREVRAPGPKARDCEFGVGVPALIAFGAGLICFIVAGYFYTRGAPTWSSEGWALGVVYGALCWTVSLIGFLICWWVDKKEREEQNG